MTTAIAESKHKKDVYKVQSEKFKKETLQADIDRAMQSLKADRVKVDLNNIEDVMQRTQDYFQACKLAGVYPSVQGLASHGFGISRQALNQWKLAHMESTTVQYLEQVNDMMADILTNESLHNNANPVQAIFQLKNNHSFSDRVELQPIPINPPNFVESPEVIKARYDND